MEYELDMGNGSPHQGNCLGTGPIWLEFDVNAFKSMQSMYCGHV